LLHKTFEDSDCQLFLTAGVVGTMAAVESAKLDNAKVKITEGRYEPGVLRQRYIGAISRRLQI
jgi:hypothetical protein